MQNLINGLINLVLVSIPEELFLTSMTLIFLKRFDLLDVRTWKQNLRRLAIPVLPVAVMVNVFRYIWVIPKPVITIGDLTLFYLLLVFVIKRNSFEFTKKDYRRIAVSLAASFAMLTVLEGITVSILLVILNKTIQFLNENILWNFLFSVPQRIVEFCIVVFILVKHHNVVQIRIINTVSKNNFLLTSVVSFAVLSNIISVYALKLISINKILENKTSLMEQSLIIMGIMVIPSVILFWMLLLINYLLVKEKQIQQSYENHTERFDLMTDVEDQ